MSAHAFASQDATARKTFCCVTLNKSEGRGVMTDGVVRSEHQRRAPESAFSQVEEQQWLIMPLRTAPHLLWTSSSSDFHFYSPLLRK